MDITVEEIEALRVPDGFTPVVGFRRFGIPWPPREPEHYLVQKGHRWMPQEPTVAECRRAGSSAHVRAHTAPYQGYGCGLHAWMDVEEVLRYYELTAMRGWVLASVIGWGGSSLTRTSGGPRRPWWWPSQTPKTLTPTNWRSCERGLHGGSRGSRRTTTCPFCPCRS